MTDERNRDVVMAVCAAITFVILIGIMLFALAPDGSGPRTQHGMPIGQPGATPVERITP